MTKDVFDCMRDCHSIRNFKQDAIPEPTLSRILEAACWAPSAGNLQPWYFYVVKNTKLRAELSQACDNQLQIKEAPVVIVVLADPSRSNEKYRERGAQLYCLQDTAVASQNILLAAEALGIGSCWVGAFDELQIQKLVEAPPRLRAVAILCLGYSNEATTETKERLRMIEVVKMID